VHTKELLDQWVDRIGPFMGIPAREVGIIGGGKLKVGDKITVGLVQSLYPISVRRIDQTQGDRGDQG